MIIMRSDATPEQIGEVVDTVHSHGLKTELSLGRSGTVIGLVGNYARVKHLDFRHFPGVEETKTIDVRYKLISREYSRIARPQESLHTITTGNLEIGGDRPVYIAGPCAIESRDRLLRIAEGAKNAGAHILRGGIFKPRTSVHSFQGIGGDGAGRAREALEWMRDAGEQFDMPVITEVRGEAQVDLVAEYVNILQIGSRNMYDQDLLIKAASTGKPVLLKRHFGAGVEEFLSYAEYIAAEGNFNIILCERGIVPVGKGKSYTRYTLDLGSVPAIQQETYLPVMVDPSHAAGRRDLIRNMSLASIASGACGLMIEVHDDPSEAMVDGEQAVTPEELKQTIDACNRVYDAMRETVEI